MTAWNFVEYAQLAINSIQQLGSLLGLTPSVYECGYFCQTVSKEFPIFRSRPRQSHSDPKRGLVVGRPQDVPRDGSPTCGNSTASNKMEWGPRTCHIADVQMGKRRGGCKIK